MTESKFEVLQPSRTSIMAAIGGISAISSRLAYDGTSYHGFQRQPAIHGRPFKENWKELGKAFAEEIGVVTAGGTDTEYMLQDKS